MAKKAGKGAKSCKIPAKTGVNPEKMQVSREKSSQPRTKREAAKEIVMLPVSEVRPYEKNPRKNQKAVKFVKASIEKFGFKVPIIIDSSRVVVCGHTRLLAAKGVLSDGCPFYVWFATREHLNFEGALNDNGLKVRQELVWNKNHFTLGRSHYQWKHEPCLYGWNGDSCRYFIDRRNQATVIEDAQELDIDKMKASEMKALLHKIYEQKLPTTVIDCNMPARDGEHPTMKPVRLFGLQITNSSRGGGRRPRYFRRLRNDNRRVRAARTEGARHGTGPEILRRDHSQVGAAHWREGGEGRRGVA